MHLKEYIIREYEKQGWVICSDFFQTSAYLPEGWIGSYPDMLAMKGNQRLAICIESSSSFIGDYTPKKWKSILKNPGLSLLVFVRDRETYNLTMQIAEMHGIELECRIIKKKVHHRKRTHDDLFKKRFRLFALVLGLVVTFITTFMLLPTTRRTFQNHMQTQIIKSYRPSDVERQFETMKKEMERMQRVR
jgi:hypothetical protein